MAMTSADGMWRERPLTLAISGGAQSARRLLIATCPN
jgi:hypothetical protein